MRSKSLIVIVGAVLVAAGVAFFAVWDASSAIDEIDAYRSEIIAIQDQASSATSPPHLKVLAIRLDDIRDALSEIPSNHRLASWLSDIEARVSDASNEAVSAEAAINKRLEL
jgi:hypothetical protein